MRGLVLALVLGVGSLQAQSNDKAEALWAKFAATVAEADRGFDGVVGVAIKDLTDGRTWAHNGDIVMPTASMIKIAILAELYRQDRLGESYLVDAKDVVPSSAIVAGLTPGVTKLTLRDLATMMMAVSDNAATNVLIDRLGMDRVNELLGSLGLSQTKLRRKMIDLAAARAGRENVATPSETVTLVEAIFRHRIVPKPKGDDLIQVLGTPKDSDIGRLLPSGVRIATKTGSLDGVRAEGGIVFAEGRPFAIAVMTTYAADERAADRIISDVALAAFRLFDRLGRSSDYGRIIR
jgi:beta-lactamase class A